MARAIWKGHISFGLVSVPVSLHTAEQRSKEISFNLLDSRDKARVRYERVNESTGEQVPWDQVVKGYEYADDEYVLITDEEMKDAVPEATQTVAIEDFVDAGSIDPIYYEKPYYLVPDKNGDKGYALLRETLRRTKKTGIARVVIRTREYLAALSVYDDVLVLDLLRFHEQLKSASDFELPSRDLDKVKITKKEIDMAVRLVESMTTEWKPENYADRFRDKLLDWIKEKVEAGDEVRPPKKKEAAQKGRIVQFVDLLERSLEERETSRGRSSQGRAARKTRKGA